MAGFEYSRSIDLKRLFFRKKILKKQTQKFYWVVYKLVSYPCGVVNKLLPTLANGQK